MAGLLLLTFFGVLGIVGIFAWVWVLNQPWRVGKKWLVTIAIWLGLLAIPLWDYIPSMLRLHEVCKDAGVKMLSDAGQGLRLGEDLATKLTIVKFGWGVTGSITTVFRKDNGALVARLRAYSVGDGHHGFLKPWLSGECPEPTGADVGISHAGALVFRELHNKLMETK